MKPRGACLLLVCLLFAPAPAGAQPAAGAPIRAIESAHGLLERAFANRYDLDFSADIDLIMRNRSGQRRMRVFRALSKVIEGRTHSIGRLTTPHYLRGMTILTIEAPGRGHDSFVFLPSLGKVRRVSTAQRSDAFLGSDVTYADLERRRVAEYDVTARKLTLHAGEAAAVVHARPKRGDGDARIEFVIALSDGAILETRHFRTGATPFRTVSMPREHMLVQAGHTLPTRMEVQSAARDTRTVVVFRNLVVNPEIDARFFSVTTLDQNRSLPGETD